MSLISWMSVRRSSCHPWQLLCLEDESLGSLTTMKVLLLWARVPQSSLQAPAPSFNLPKRWELKAEAYWWSRSQSRIWWREKRRNRCSGISGSHFTWRGSWELAFKQRKEVRANNSKGKRGPPCNIGNFYEVEVVPLSNKMEYGVSASDKLSGMWNSKWSLNPVWSLYSLPPPDPEWYTVCPGKVDIMKWQV